MYCQSHATNAATATKPFPSKLAHNALHSSEATVLSLYRSAMACSKVMKTYILATQLFLSHAAISSAFATMSAGPSECLAVAFPGDI